MKLNERIKFFTDTATLAIFDPLVLQHRKNDVNWIDDDFSTLPEVIEGKIALISIANDGYYDVKVTDELSPDEKNFAREVTPLLGFVSISGQVFIGQGEFLPANGVMPTPADLKQKNHFSQGKFIDIPEGEYDLLAYSIDASDYASEKVAKSLSNMVLVITKRTHTFQPVTEEPRINVGVDTFLFPSAKNKQKLKPRVGKILEGVVYKVPRLSSGLAIKRKGSIWPSSYFGYDIVLKDMSQVEWQDRVKIKTVEVDVDNKIIYAELLEKRKNDQS